MRFVLLARVLGLFGVVADVPRLDALFPPGGRVGTEFGVIATGSLDPWPVRMWSDDTNIVFRPGGTNRQYHVTIDAATQPGAHLVRAFNAEGASAPHIFVVGVLPEQTERSAAEEEGDEIERVIEPPGEGDREQLMPLAQFPVTMNGEIAQPGERDVYLLDLVGDQTLSAELTAIGIDSPLVGMLVLADARGSVLGVQASVDRRDPTLVARIPRPGRYRLQVTAGGQPVAAFPAVYRLTLEVEVATEAEVAVMREPESENQQAPTLRATQGGTRLFFPGVVRGHIDPPGDVDRYGFDADEGAVYVFTGWASGQAADFEFVLKVADADEQVLRSSGGGAAPYLVWSAPWDGYFVLVVEGVESGGGQCQYTIELAEPYWHIQASVEEHAVRIAPGETARLPIQLIRPRRYEGYLEVTPSFLPSGVSTPVLVTGPDQVAVDLVLTAATNAVPASGPISVLVEPIGSPNSPFETVRYSLRGRYAPSDGLLTNETDRLWLTVTSPRSSDDEEGGDDP